MQAAGDLVSSAAEFASRMELGKDQVHRVSSCLVVDADRDPSSVVFHRHAAVFVDGHFDLRAVTGQRFIHGIVHDLIDQMVKSPG